MPQTESHVHPLKPVGPGMAVLCYILRPIINWAVERIFTDHAFFGDNFLRVFNHAPSNTPGQAAKGTAAAVHFLVANAIEMGAAEFEATLLGLSIAGVSHGDWRITIAQIAEPETDTEEDT